MKRRPLAMLLCALLCCTAIGHASEPSIAHIPNILEMRGLGIAVYLDADWRALIAQGRINFALDYTIQPQDQIIETVSLDIFYWHEPPEIPEEIDMAQWEAAGAIRVARVYGERRAPTASATPSILEEAVVLTPVDDVQSPMPSDTAPPVVMTPECLALETRGDYGYELRIYPVPDDAPPEACLIIDQMQAQLRVHDAVIRTFEPEPLNP